MTKDELINITLKQLIDSFRNSPERLHLEDPELGGNNYLGPTIVWKFKIEIDGKSVQDPNNAIKTVIVSYNPVAKQLTAYIFFRDVSSIHSTIMADAVATIKYNKYPWMHQSYRKFMYLRKKLIQRHREKESIDYIKKLSAIFPAIFDDELLR